MIRIGKIDYEGKAFTYGMRIELGDIFSDTEERDYPKLCRAFRCVYGYSHRWLPMRLRIRRFDEILEGLKGWVDKEQQLLQYTPTAEELSAGINTLAQKVGAMATIKQLARAYGVDPDEVLKWSYSKVFGILYTDLEERKFEQKLQKEYGKRTKH